MLARGSLLVLASVLALGAFVPGIATRLFDAEASTGPEVAADEAPVRAAIVGKDGEGQFAGLFTINGHPETALVEPGSRMVTMNVSTAVRLGIDRDRLHFRYAVETPQGKVRAAYVRLDRVEIGAVGLDRVSAMVLDDKALAGTRIGMSFLRGLSAYRLEKDGMHLIR